MKKLLFTGIISTLLLLGLSGCYKTCESPFAPNYTLEGACIDLTASITGNYTGQLMDSIVGLHSTTTNSVTIQLTKIDDAHVQVSSTLPAFVAYSAVVSQSANGYYLTVPSQTATNGLTVVGAGTYFGASADGVYVSSDSTLTVYALAGTQYQGFTGKQ